MISEIFNTIFYDPIFNLLLGLYEILPFADLGIAIVLFTILLRILLYPLTAKALRSQRLLQDLQPKLKEIRGKYKKQPQRVTQEMMRLYRENKVSPFGGFVPILIQFPILIALFYVLRGILETPDAAFAQHLYSFVSQPETFRVESFGGAVDLAGRSLILAVFTGIAQYIQSHLAFQKAPAKDKESKGDFANAMAFQMRYVFPVAIIGIGAVLPAGITLYLFVTTAFSAFQQVLFNRSFAKQTLV